MSSMSETGVPSRTSSGSASTIKEIGRPFQTFSLFALMALEKRALVDVQVPIGDADGEVAEWVGCDVDSAGNKTVALHRRERSIVPDDLGDRIRRRHVASPPPWYEMHGRTHRPGSV